MIGLARARLRVTALSARPAVSLLSGQHGAAASVLGGQRFMAKKKKKKKGGKGGDGGDGGAAASASASGDFDFDVKAVEKKMKKTVAHFEEELKRFRGGGADPSKCEEGLPSCVLFVG